ncbi:MAG: BamA/TamA family outer membrane protein [Gemmatimonadota bacterium]|nr:MAG: BamA/TamA family outer membrane protein [Gemmatimonadota bacterium]
MRLTLLTAIVFSVVASSASAQRLIPNLPTLGSSWTDVGYPKAYWTPTNGFSFGLFYSQIRPPGYDDWDAPPPYRANISLDAEISTSGSYHLGLDFKFPNFFPGWRFDLRVWTMRAARQNYFGVGNNTAFERDSVTDEQPYYYRMDRRRLFVRGTAQRHIVGGLRALAGFHVERWKLDTLSGTTLLGEQVQAGVAPLVGVSVWQPSLRLGLVFDTRDDEVTPHRGVFVEALFDVADSNVVGDVSFNRFSISTAAYYSLLEEKLVLAGRVAGQSLSGSPPVGSYFNIEASERVYSGLGGPLSHRAIYTDRFLAQDKIFGSLDVRYLVGGSPQIATLSLLGFVDAGRVYQPPDEFTLKDLHVGGGLGPILTIGRNGILGMTFAWGPDKLIVQTHTSWAF